MINEENIKLKKIKKLSSIASFYKTDKMNELKEEVIDKINIAITTIIIATEFNEEVLDAYLFLKKIIPNEYIIALKNKEQDKNGEEVYSNYSLKLLVELCTSYLKDFGNKNNDLTKMVRYYFSVLINEDSMPEEVNEARTVLENILSQFYGTKDENLYQQMSDKLKEFRKKSK